MPPHTSPHGMSSRRVVNGAMKHPVKSKTHGEINRANIAPFASGIMWGGHRRKRWMVVTKNGNVFIGKKGQNHTSISREWGIPTEEILEECEIARGPGNATAKSSRDASAFFHTPHTSPETKKAVESVIREFHPHAKFKDVYISKYH